MKNRNRIAAITAGVVIAGFVPLMSIGASVTHAADCLSEAETYTLSEAEQYGQPVCAPTPECAGAESECLPPPSCSEAEQLTLSESECIAIGSVPAAPVVAEAAAVRLAPEASTVESLFVHAIEPVADVAPAPTVSVPHSPGIAPPAAVDTVPSRDPIRGARGGW